MFCEKICMNNNISRSVAVYIKIPTGVDVISVRSNPHIDLTRRQYGTEECNE